MISPSPQTYPAADSDRELLHHRCIDVRGWRRRDGLFEVEATLTDTKALPKPWTRSDGVLHQMSICVTFDDDFVVHDIQARSGVVPYPVCAEAAAGLATLKGLSMASGWVRTVRERLGGVKGCTHLVEMLAPVATTAFQTTSELRMSRPDRLDSNGRPVKIDTCLAYSRHGDLVRQRWPEHYQSLPRIDSAVPP